MKIALITGASGGMGRWYAEYAPDFAKDIDEVWLVGRSKKRLQKTAAGIKVPVRVIRMDLTKPEEEHKLSDLLFLYRPSIRLLVNAAGCGMIGPFAEVGRNDHAETLLLNCSALTKVTHLCLPFMNRGSHIIMVGSAAAFLPQPDFAVYAASKSYVVSFSMALSRELRRRGILVTSVCPGAVKTGFFRHAEKYHKRKAYKNLFMADSRKVVTASLKDACKGKKISVPGFWVKVFWVLSRLLPHRFLLLFL